MAPMFIKILTRVVNFLLPVLVITLIFSGANTHAARGFLSVIEDLPLMDGLEEVRGSVLTFSTPQGRIIEASANGSLKLKKVLTFYALTLPQLGWKPLGVSSWVREREMLLLTVLVKNGMLTVRFSLTPH